MFEVRYTNHISKKTIEALSPCYIKRIYFGGINSDKIRYCNVIISKIVLSETFQIYYYLYYYISNLFIIPTKFKMADLQPLVALI